MAKEVKGFKSDSGALFATHRDAVADDLIVLIEEVTGGERDIDRVLAAAMVEHAKRFAAVLSQREGGKYEPSVDDLLEDLAYAKQALVLIRDQEMGAGGSLGPKAIMDGMKRVAAETLHHLNGAANK